MAVSGRRWAAGGDKGWRLERKMDKSGGRRLQRQSRTKEDGYVVEEVLGGGDSTIFNILSYYFYARRTWDGKREIGWRRKHSD